MAYKNRISGTRRRALNRPEGLLETVGLKGWHKVSGLGLVQFRELGDVLFCSLTVLDPRVGHTMNILSPFFFVLCHSD